MPDISNLDIKAAIEFSTKFVYDTNTDSVIKEVSVYRMEQYLVNNGFIAHVSSDLQDGPIRVDDFTVTVLKITKDLGYKVMRTPHAYFTI